MALEKSIAAPTGAIASYWKIQALFMEVVEKKGQVILYGYENKLAKDNGSPYVHRIIYDLYGADFEVFSITNMDTENPIKLMYNHIKASDGRFIDAVDV